MAVKELREGGSCGISLGGTKSVKRKFLVTGNDPSVAINDPDLPKLGEYFPGSGSMRVTGKDAERYGTKFCAVDVSYETKSNSDNDAVDREAEEKPTVEWDMSATTITEYFAPRSQDKDAPYEKIGPNGEGCSKYVPQCTLRITIPCASSFSAGLLLQMAGTVNASRWWGGARGTWLCLGATASATVERNAKPSVTYTFVYDKKGHQFRWYEVDENGDPVGDAITSYIQDYSDFSVLKLEL